MDDNIRKYQEISTHSAANYQAIGETLTFHQSLGSEGEEVRSRNLRDYWTDLSKPCFTLPDTGFRPDQFGGKDE